VVDLDHAVARSQEDLDADLHAMPMAKEKMIAAQTRPLNQAPPVRSSFGAGGNLQGRTD
jgi:hypothetical protein